MDNLIKTLDKSSNLLIVNWVRASSGKDSAPSIYYATKADDFTLNSVVGGGVTINRNIKLIFNVSNHVGRNNKYILYDASGATLEELNATYQDQSFTTTNIKQGYSFKSRVGSDSGYTTQTIWLYE